MSVKPVIQTSIKCWPVSERPRERLLAKGAQALSDAELLAVLLRNGVKGKDAVSLARELLAKYGGLRGLLSQESKAATPPPLSSSTVNHPSGCTNSG